MKARHVLISAILALFSSVALAGKVESVPVIVDLDNEFAQGDMFSARTAMNDVEFIGCGVRNIDDGVIDFEFGFCQAGDADENQVVCFTENESLLETMGASASYSFLTFSWQDDGFGGFECTRVGHSTQSWYLPKK